MIKWTRQPDGLWSHTFPWWMRTINRLLYGVQDEAHPLCFYSVTNLTDANDPNPPTRLDYHFGRLP